MTDDKEHDETQPSEGADQSEGDAMARLREQLKAIGLPRLVISGATVAAVGALVSFFAAGDDVAGPSADDAAPAEPSIMLCHPELFTTPDGCTTMAALAAREQSDVFSPGVFPSRAFTMVSATDDEAAPREVQTCATFVPLKQAGWGGLTSGDMRREAQLVRACGLLVLAERGQLTADAAPMTAELWARIDGETLPALGEVGFPADARVQKGEDPRVWTAGTDQVRGRFVDVGMADFDGDGAAEHLVEWTIMATGGTLAARGFGFVAPSGATFTIVDPFKG
ncbi:MAG: hypothetical protein AAFR65_07790 [Pseudomonadota bacterium]